MKSPSNPRSKSHHGGAETRRTAAAKRSLSPNLYLPGIGKTIRWHRKQRTEPTSITFPLTKESTKVNITCLFTYVYVVYRKLSFACDVKEFDTNSGHKSAGIPGVKLMHPGVESAKRFRIIVEVAGEGG